MMPAPRMTVLLLAMVTERSQQDMKGRQRNGERKAKRIEMPLACDVTSEELYSNLPCSRELWSAATKSPAHRRQKTPAKAKESPLSLSLCLFSHMDTVDHFLQTLLRRMQREIIRGKTGLQQIMSLRYARPLFWCETLLSRRTIPTNFHQPNPAFSFAFTHQLAHPHERSHPDKLIDVRPSRLIWSCDICRLVREYIIHTLWLPQRKATSSSLLAPQEVL